MLTKFNVEGVLSFQSCVHISLKEIISSIEKVDDKTVSFMRFDIEDKRKNWFRQI